MAEPVPAPGADGTVPVVPRALYYLIIDGTAAKDSVAYGRLLQEHGWHNLATEFLKPAPDDATRLVDPAHPYLPICLFAARGQRNKIAVVSPAGRDSNGIDEFWRRYAGELPEELPFGGHSWTQKVGPRRTTVGRHTAAEKSGRLMNHLLRNPVIETRTDGDIVTAELSTGLIDPWAKGKYRAFAADLLLVSSHGWLGGFMRGNRTAEWSAAEPADARKPYGPMLPYFVVGEAAESQVGFSGPAWIILAQCSTLNSATWALWARVLANSIPNVRGILAYEEVSPGPEGSITIAERFFKEASGKNPKRLVEAWAIANSHEKWAAIVHQEAVNDTLERWRSFAPLSSVATTANTGVYLGFLATTRDSLAKGGDLITDAPPPFVLKLDTQFPQKPVHGLGPDDFPWGHYVEVTPATLHFASAGLFDSLTYRITITAPAGGTVVSASLQWIHIRSSFRPQPNAEAVFASIELGPATPGSARLQVSGNKVDVRAGSDPIDRLELLFMAQPRAKLEQAGLEVHHSYLWPSVDLTTEPGTLHFDFKTIGLSFNG